MDSSPRDQSPLWCLVTLPLHRSRPASVCDLLMDFHQSRSKEQRSGGRGEKILSQRSVPKGGGAFVTVHSMQQTSQGPAQSTWKPLGGVSPRNSIWLECQVAPDTVHPIYKGGPLPPVPHYGGKMTGIPELRDCVLTQPGLV